MCHPLADARSLVINLQPQALMVSWVRVSELQAWGALPVTPGTHNWQMTLDPTGFGFLLKWR